MGFSKKIRIFFHFYFSGLEIFFIGLFVGSEEKFCIEEFQLMNVEEMTELEKITIF